jgi:hypothetical protein
MKFIELLLARIQHLEENEKNTTRQLGAHGRLIQENTERMVLTYIDMRAIRRRESCGFCGHLRPTYRCGGCEVGAEQHYCNEEHRGEDWESHMVWCADLDGEANRRVDHETASAMRARGRL